MSEPAYVDPPFPARVGSCIYCDATEGLTDEHVIPFSLGGEWELVDASCPRCAQVTSGIERHVSRELLIAFRTVARLPTYHPKRRPSTLRQVVTRAGGEEHLDLAPDRHPAPVALPIFAVPTFFTGEATPTSRVTKAVRVFARPAKVRELGEKHGATQWMIPAPNRVLFARFIAKVGFSFAVGCIGLEAFAEIFVRNSILGASDDIARWVGCVNEETPPPPEGTHTITLSARDGLVFAQVRLFTLLRTPRYTVPEYTVVVGRARQT